MAPPLFSECFVACLDSDLISVGIVTDCTMPAQANLIGDTEILILCKAVASSARQRLDPARTITHASGKRVNRELRIRLR